MGRYRLLLVSGDDLVTTGDGPDLVIGGTHNDDIDMAGNDAAQDLAIGDNGQMLFSGGLLTSLSSSDPGFGGDDIITSGDGTDLVIGGLGSDEVHAGNGDNVVLGDQGAATFEATANIDHLESSDPTLGGDDEIYTGDGADIVIGGTGSDSISAGDGNDLILGDSGRLAGQVIGAVLPLTSSVFTFTSIFTQDADLGNGDFILGEGGDDILLGQQGSDTIYGGTGDDDIIGGVSSKLKLTQTAT